jgi:hypothetical protein
LHLRLFNADPHLTFVARWRQVIVLWWVRNSAIAAARLTRLYRSQKGHAMTQLDSNSRPLLKSRPRHLQHTQTMLVAGGLVAFAIVAVAAAMMTTLL